MNVDIIGAGLSGLIAATQFPTAQVFEAEGPDSISHKAVLRFRSNALSQMLGIPFKRVEVRKSIWHKGAHRAASIDLANLYSRKTNGGYHNRSIWNLDKADRYIAPEDLQLQLAAQIENRLHWNTPILPEEVCDPERQHAFISTMPLPVLLKMLNWTPAETFSFKSIRVDRFRVSGADLYQTIYYPDPELSVYRASLTGDLLIIEHVEEQADLPAEMRPRLLPCFDDVIASFGLQHSDVAMIELNHRQRFGKIAPLVHEKWRQWAIYEATVKHHIYSLGRFATWRNILLDDIVNDIAIIKRMLQQGAYGATLQHNRGTDNERSA